jgi:hypothetical protein
MNSKNAKNIVERQTIVISNNMQDSTDINVPIDLRFYADEMILKEIVFNSAGNAVVTTVLIWSNLPIDQVIGVFSSGSIISDAAIPTFSGAPIVRPNNHFQLSSRFKTGVVNFQFQEPNDTAPFIGGKYMAAGTINGTVTFTLEFVRHE